jgi:nucleotide-binding universal stress UspA family protein
MPFKDIVVHVDLGPASEPRVQLACEIARRHRAHLLAFYCLELAPFTRFSPWGDPGYSDFASIQNLQQNYRAAALAAAGKIEAVFHAEANRAGINGKWRFVEGIGTASVVRQARYADLAILGQANPEAPSQSSVVPEEVVLSSGGPVLIVPQAGRFASACRRVLVAWNASREAARAVADALPFLTRAEAVQVLVVDAQTHPTAHGEEPGADIAQHLVRHGAKVDVRRLSSGGVAVGRLILSEAAAFGADLVVMGAYGHSRLTEFVFGSATRTALQEAGIPVLMSR